MISEWRFWWWSNQSETVWIDCKVALKDSNRFDIAASEKPDIISFLFSEQRKPEIQKLRVEMTITWKAWTAKSRVLNVTSALLFNFHQFLCISYVNILPSFSASGKKQITHYPQKIVE